MDRPKPFRTLVRLLMLIVAYFAASAISRGLSVGQASPIWLPTGIAVAAILIWGYRMAPAVLLGAIGFDAFVNTTWGNDETAVWSGIATGLGATLQAIIVAYLLRKAVPDGRALNVTTVRDALRFAIVGATACTISATVGAVSLTAAHLVAEESSVYFWTTWWVGDVCGLLIVTPALLVLRNWRHRRSDWTQLTLPIIGVGLGLTLISAFLIYHLDRDARSRDFARSGAAIANAVDRAMELTIHDLNSAQVLFARGPVSETDFSEFALNIRRRNPRIETLSWSQRTPADAVTALERRRRAEGAEDYSVFELDARNLRVAAGKREVYYPVVYADPTNTRGAVLGYDTSSEPRRKSAQSVALLTGAASATEPLHLIDDDQRKVSVLIYLPIYPNLLGHDSGPGQQSETALGFVTASVSIPALMADSLAPFDAQHIETWLIDRSGADTPLLLHVSGSRRVVPGSTVPAMTALQRGVHYASRFSVAGRDWMVICRPHDSARVLHAAGLVGLMLIGGFGLTLMLATYMVTRQRNETELRARDERLLSQNAVLTLLAQRPMATAETLQNGFRELAATAAVTLKVARASIWLLEDEHRRMRCQCLYQRDADHFDSDAVLEAEDYPRYFAALLENRRIAADDAARDPRTREFLPSYLLPLRIGAMLDAPIRLGGHLVGVICHEHVGEPRAWTLDEQSFAGSMGDMASLMLESAHRSTAEAALQEANQALEDKVAKRTLQLNAANEKLREMDRLKSMFIASMSHELRTPLNSIIGFTGVVLQGISGAINERQKDQLTRVFNSARHLLSLITDVIDISKIEAGYVQVYQESLLVHDVIEEALATVQPQANEKGLALVADLPRDTAVTSDRKRLLQCVLNLLSNAVKYTEHGTVTVRILAGEDRIVIEVEDTGIGIDENAQKRLFEPFERIDSHLRIRTPGTGLGLYLTRKIAVELLQGGVEAESTPGVGSRFTLWIPRQPVPAAEATHSSEGSGS